MGFRNRKHCRCIVFGLFFVAIALTMISALSGTHLSFLFTSFKPMPISAALCVVSLAGSVSVCNRNGGNLGRLFALPSIVLGFLALGRWCLYLSAGPSEGSQLSESGLAMALPTALCALFLGLVLAGSPSDQWDRRWNAIVGMTAAFVATSSFVVLTSFLAGIDFAGGWDAINLVSPISAGSFMLLGLSLVLVASRKSLAAGWGVRWIAPPFAAVILSGTLLLWHAQVEAEKQVAARATAQAGNAIRDHLEAKLETQALDLQLLAQSPQIDEKQIRIVLEHSPEIESVDRLEANGALRWQTARNRTENSILNSDANIAAVQQALKAAQLNQKISVSSALSQHESSRCFLICVPIMNHGSFDGVLALDINLDRFVKSIPFRFSHDYHIEISDLNSIIYTDLFSPDVVDDLGACLTLSLRQSRWRILVVPTQATVSQWQTSIPGFILLVGAITAILTTFALLIWERGNRLARREKETKEFLESLAETSLTASYVLDLKTFQIVYANRFAFETLGLTEEEYHEGGLAYVRSAIHPDDWRGFVRRVHTLRKLSDGEVFQFEVRSRLPNGQWSWLLVRECVLRRDPKGVPIQVLGSAQDITARKLAEQEVLRNKEELETTFDSAPIGIALVSPSGRWLRVNPALCEIVGYSTEELLASDFQSITHPDDVEVGIERTQKLLEGQGQVYRCEKRYLHKSGRLIWAMITVALTRDSEGKPLHFISQIQDITEQKLQELEMQRIADGLTQANFELEQLSRVDALTGAYNRRHFDERLQLAVKTAERYDRPLSIVMLDVDHFKQFNDEFGHRVGDEVLRLVATAASEVCRSTDLFSRYGGEEFVILCTETNVRGATRLAEKLRERISQIQLPYRTITASFGIASVFEGEYDAESLVKRADDALYIAKDLGRNCVYVDAASTFKDIARNEDWAA